MRRDYRRDTGGPRSVCSRSVAAAGQSAEFDGPERRARQWDPQALVQHRSVVNAPDLRPSDRRMTVRRGDPKMLQLPHLMDVDANRNFFVTEVK